MEAKKKEIKKPTLFMAVLPLIFMFVVLFTGLVIYSIDIKILLIICAAFTICVCMYQGHTWKDIEDEIVAKLAKAFPAIMILICVGLMIGAWAEQFRSLYISDFRSSARNILSSLPSLLL